MSCVILVTGQQLVCVSNQVIQCLDALTADTYSYDRDVLMSQFATGNSGPKYCVPDSIHNLDSSSGIKCLGP